MKSVFYNGKRLFKKKNIDFRRQIYKFLNCDYQAGELSQSSLVPIKN